MEKDLINWHQFEAGEVFKELGSGKQGLSPEEAARKLEEVGPNKLQEKKKKPAWKLFVAQFKDFMILVLVAAAIISGVVGDLADTIIILIIVFLNALVGFIQEYRAEKAMEALQKMAAPKAKVKRQGAVSTIDATELVPGDLVVLEAGDLVPADLRLLEVHALRVEESSLTGESVPVDKNVAVMEKGETMPGDRINMAYKSTMVTNGRGEGVVVGTGMNTEIGQIAGMLQEEESETPLQKRMNDFGKKLTYLIIVICVVLFGVGMLRGEETINMLLVAISLAVAAIPEALPALITIALARGAKRLVSKNALIRKLPAVETLGSVTYICSDKTGTLTQNKMHVEKLVPREENNYPDAPLPFLEFCMYLNQDVKKDKEGDWVGDPTEVAMVAHVEKNFKDEDLEQIKNEYKREEEIPFDSDRKCMSTIHRFGDQYLLITKGATEAILARLNENDNTDDIHQESEKLASEGIRVLAYGYRILKDIPEVNEPGDIEKDLEFVGMAGLIDPPREEARVAIGECTTAGIETVMITGDHRETAAAIARELGILRENKKVVSGKELKEMGEQEYEKEVENISVYARVSPRQKLQIVKALQNKNHFAAMTGDGVNDAPSLKAANIGIAMGITGTEVSKQASHMILLDDNFATIVKAVKEGRRIYDNIRKFVKYIMTCNSAEIWTIFIAPLIGLPIPLLPIHILWINLVTDGLPGLALSSEKGEKDIMKRPPRKTDESLFAGGTGYHIIWVGILMAAITLGVQAWAIGGDNERWQTMVFTVLSLSQLGHVMAIRSERDYIFKIGFFSNIQLIVAVLFTIALQMAVIYLPAANGIFKTQPLTMMELAICFGLSTIVFIAVEIEKGVKKRMGFIKK